MRPPDRAGRRIVIGVGNEYRGDDGLGPAVLERLRGRPPDGAVLAGCDGEPARMLELWDGAELAVVVDAVAAGGHGGQRYELHAGDLPPDADPVSSHALGLGETVALARALDRMPRRLVVLAVGGADFRLGAGLSPRVAAAVDPVVRRVRELLAGGGAGPRRPERGGS